MGFSESRDSQTLRKPYLIGIDIGGTNLRIGAVSPDYRVTHTRLESSWALLDSHSPMDALATVIRDFIREAGSNAQGICIGFPGTVAKSKATVLSCPNIPLFDGVDVSGPLEAAFGVPVHIEHDVIFLLAADLQRYGLYGKESVIAVYAGTGMGNAIYVNGGFLDGKNGVAGELGHIPVFGSKAPCPCGGTGCLEAHASGVRLVQIQREHFPQTSSLGQMFLQHGGHPVLEEFLEHLAAAIAIEINIFDPDAVLLGGGVINMEHFPYDHLLDMISSHLRKPYPAENIRFQRSAIDPELGIRGAGIFFHRLERTKRTQPEVRSHIEEESTV